MAALTASQRTTVRNGFVTLATNNPGFSNGMTPGQWADLQMAALDAYRANTKSRTHWTVRMQPWIQARMGFGTTLRNAINTHCLGN